MKEIHGKSMLLQVSGRFELPVVRVIGSRMYHSIWVKRVYTQNLLITWIYPEHGYNKDI